MSGTWWVKPDDLDDQQKEAIAITPNCNALISGPPGSGKTNLLLLRASFLDKGVSKNFVVLTFGRVLKEFIKTGTSNYDVPIDRVQTYVSWAIQLLGSNGIKTPPKLEMKPLRAFLQAKLSEVLALEKPENQIDFILIDEVQDYTIEELETIKGFSKFIFAVGDTKQQIYQEQDSIKHLKSQVDKIIQLKYHYRNGIKICRLADGIVNLVDSAEGMEATSFYNEKIMPSVAKSYPNLTLEEQVDLVIEELENQLIAYPDEMIGISAPTIEDVRKIWEKIASSKLSGKCMLQLKEDGYGSFDPNIKIIIGTMHSMKGLEFRACHILACDHLSKFREQQKKVAYTGCTRTKTSLRVYHTNPLPPYFAQAFANLEPAPTIPAIDSLFAKAE